MYLLWLSRLFPPASLLAHIIVHFLTIRPFKYHIYKEKVTVQMGHAVAKRQAICYGSGMNKDEEIEHLRAENQQLQGQVQRQEDELQHLRQAKEDLREGLRLAMNSLESYQQPSRRWYVLSARSPVFSVSSPNGHQQPSRPLKGS